MGKLIRYIGIACLSLVGLVGCDEEKKGYNEAAAQKLAGMQPEIPDEDIKPRIVKTENTAYLPTSEPTENKEYKKIENNNSSEYTISTPDQNALINLESDHEGLGGIMKRDEDGIASIIGNVDNHIHSRIKGNKKFIKDRGNYGESFFVIDNDGGLEKYVEHRMGEEPKTVYPRINSGITLRPPTRPRTFTAHLNSRTNGDGYLEDHEMDDINSISFYQRWTFIYGMDFDRSHNGSDFYMKVLDPHGGLYDEITGSIGPDTKRVSKTINFFEREKNHINCGSYTIEYRLNNELQDTRRFSLR